VKADEVLDLIREYEDVLGQYSPPMSPSVQRLEEQTVKALRELHVRIIADEEAQKVIQAAKDILSRS